MLFAMCRKSTEDKVLCTACWVEWGSAHGLCCGPYLSGLCYYGSCLGMYKYIDTPEMGYLWTGRDSRILSQYYAPQLAYRPSQRTYYAGDCGISRQTDFILIRWRVWAPRLTARAACSSDCRIRSINADDQMEDNLLEVSADLLADPKQAGNVDETAAPG